MPENKTKPTQVSVAAYIEAIPDEGKRADAKALVKLMQSATGEKAKMWGPSIVGFGSYHYRYETGREGDMPLACFSPRKSATVVYGMGGLDDAVELWGKLGKHKLSGSCLHIHKLADVNRQVLESLILKSVAARRAEHVK
jgi:hypothetical protein